MPDGNLLFDTDPSFPVLWVAGLIGFLALSWYAVRDSPAQRRSVLVLWAPATLVAILVYRYGQQGRSTADTLRLLVERDPHTVRQFLGPKLEGPALIFGFVVGGSSAVLVTMTCHLAGLVLGAIGLFTGGGRRRSRPL